jgi:hypothetical protein
MRKRKHRFRSVFLLAIVCLGGDACRLKRPVTIPTRMIEPQLFEPAKQETGATSASPVRLLETESRRHIGRRVLHQQPNGELTEDPVWRWSSAPDRYLDTALRLELTSSPSVHLIDDFSAPTLAATLIVWNLESAGETRLVGAVEFRFTGSDRAVHTRIVRATESVSAELPGNLAVASGNLLRRLAAEGVTSITR